MSRPEYAAPPEMFYNDTEAAKYHASSRMIDIQNTMTERALELMNLPQTDSGLLLLDVGCGSGLSGNCLSKHGHTWIGMDISTAMLEVAVKVSEVDGDVLALDMGI